jgi:transposase-like protein
LVEGIGISKVCEEAGIAPSQFYRWQQELFEGGAGLLDRRRGRRQAEVSKDSQKVERLERKLQEKDEVLGELMAEYVALKKKNGES